MPIQAPQWTDFKLCPVCQNEFNAAQKPPVSLGCGHSVCRSCLLRLAKQQCPFDQAEIRNDITKLPVNYALLSLCSGPPIPAHFDVDIVEIRNNRKQFDAARRAIEVLAESLQNVVITSSNNNYSNGVLTRPMQRKIVSIIHCQLGEPEGQARAMRAARSIGERAVKELILMHQSPQTLSTALWAAVRQRGCQFLGPAMQEAVLGFILLALEDGISLSRKVLVLFVVQRLEKQFTQASKTSIGHVVQLLYRASCFKVTKRDGDSSLLLLHEKYRTASALRKEHDAQIVQIAMEAGLHISPEQWSALLYGDDDHKSHMQSIIDKLQTPASFASSIQELIIALQRTDDPHDLQELQTHLEKLAAIDPSTEAPAPTWEEIEEAMNSLLVVVTGLKNFAKDYTSKNKGNIEGAQMINTKYRTSMCRDIMQRNTCPRGANCNFAHTEEELERYRKRRNLPVGRVNAPTPLSAFSQDGVSSRAGSTSSPDSCSDVADDFADLSINPSSPNRNLSISIPQQGVMPPHYRPVVTSAVYQTPSIGEPVVGSQFNSAHMKKEDVMSARDMMNQITPAVTHYNAVMRPSPLPQQPPPMQTAGGYMGQHQQQQSFYEMQRPAPAQQISPEQLYMQHQGGNTYNMYQQQQQPTQQPFYPSMQGHHQGGGYPAMAAHPNMFPPMGHFFSRTAVARGTANNMDDNTSSMREKNELSLSIPPLKESKDEWKNEMRSRGDSYIDSGRGSSLGYSSDATFSPRSSGSSGSRSSPPGNDKLWGESIWANVTDPSPVSSKSSPWSRWNLGSESRCDDERNSSTDSVTSKETISDERRYSMLKDWSGDILNNNRPSSHSLLGMYNQGQQQQQQGVRPPPGFKLLLEN